MLTEVAFTSASLAERESNSLLIRFMLSHNPAFAA
jgi:hypothetical protein